MSTIELAVGRERNEFSLFSSDGKIVRDVVSLVGPIQKFKQNDTLYCIIGNAKLFCTYTTASNTTKITTICVQQSDDIEDIKEKIQLQLGIPIEQQKLYYEAHELRDGITLSEHNIPSDSCIQMRPTSKPLLSPSWEQHIVSTFPVKMQKDLSPKVVCQMTLKVSCGEYLLQCVENFHSKAPLMSNLMHTSVDPDSLWCEQSFPHRVMVVELKSSLCRNAQNQPLPTNEMQEKIEDVRKIKIIGGDIRSWQLYTSSLPVACTLKLYKSATDLDVRLKPNASLKTGTWYAILLLHTNRYITEDTVIPFQTKLPEVIDLRPNMQIPTHQNTSLFTPTTTTTTATPTAASSAVGNKRSRTEAFSSPASTVDIHVSSMAAAYSHSSISASSTSHALILPSSLLRSHNQPNRIHQEVIEVSPPPAKRHHALLAEQLKPANTVTPAVAFAAAADTTASGERSPAHCLICTDKPANIAYSPCGHVASCPSCDKALTKRVCILCRARIKSVLKVYLP